MKYFSRIFAPTNNRRLNELIGFLLCVSALLLFLALASYSPLDPSLNSASVLTGSSAARNWIGVVGALISDLILQFFGVGAFLIPVFAAGLGVRWFRSRKIVAPIAKALGAAWLVVFLPALLALLPGQATEIATDVPQTVVAHGMGRVIAERCQRPVDRSIVVASADRSEPSRQLSSPKNSPSLITVMMISVPSVPSL